MVKVVDAATSRAIHLGHGSVDYGVDAWNTIMDFQVLRDARMKRTASVAAIFLVSYGLALLIAPPDRFMFCVEGGAITLFGISCYVLGLHETRRSRPDP